MHMNSTGISEAMNAWRSAPVCDDNDDEHASEEDVAPKLIDEVILGEMELEMYERQGDLKWRHSLGPRHVALPAMIISAPQHQIICRMTSNGNTSICPNSMQKSASDRVK